MGLRLSEGVDLATLAIKTGFCPSLPLIAPLEKQGLLARDGAWLKTTREGRLVLNALVDAVSAALRQTETPQY